MKHAAAAEDILNGGRVLRSGRGRYPHGKITDSVASGDTAKQYAFSFVEAIFSGRKCPTE
jgi:hypothetical protein